MKAELNFRRHAYSLRGPGVLFVYVAKSLSNHGSEPTIIGLLLIRHSVILSAPQIQIAANRLKFGGFAAAPVPSVIGPREHLQFGAAPENSLRYPIFDPTPPPPLGYHPPVRGRPLNVVQPTANSRDRIRGDCQCIRCSNDEGGPSGSH